MSASAETLQGSASRRIVESVPPLAAIRKIAVLGNYLPRRCGIATFTTDLTEAIAVEFPQTECFVLAMNDHGKRHAYPGRVRFEIADTELTGYRRAAEFLNASSVDVLSVQHEFGIYGGEAGGHVLALLRDLRVPVVTTLHTVLAEPTVPQRYAMDALAQLSERLVVMSPLGVKLLRDVHGVPDRKIDLIPHGIHDLPTPKGSKGRLGLEGKAVLLTFGLLSPDKGIEHVIDALPAILARHPNTVYVVLGETHPHVKQHHGETYRRMLESRAQELGVSSNVIFHDRFVSQAELGEFLDAADIYLTPYLKPEQITSGTLAYAVGAGKAVISTPYWYAQELLADGRGILAPFGNAQAIAREVTGLLSDERKRLGLGERARAHGRDMIWPAVSRAYVKSFERARTGYAGRMCSPPPPRRLASRTAALPEINLEHLRRMTDDTGILQHAVFSVPRYADGYCLDDNARALCLMALIESAGNEDSQTVQRLGLRYLAFVNHALNPRSGRFRNFMAYSRQWTEECGSEDSHGRALWAVGTVLGRAGDPGTKSLAAELFRAALPAVSGFSSPRAWAFTLLGIDEYLRVSHGDRDVQSTRAAIAERLLGLFRRTAKSDWPWFEDRLTYSNARLSQSLIVSGARMGHEEMTAVGLRSLEWLVSVQSLPEKSFAPIGSNGFYERGMHKASFDQQPLEACGMVSACLEAQRLTAAGTWGAHARQAFSWFLGHNHLGQPLYDARTGGCRDGLHADRVNENQGAESTLSFLLALMEMRSADPIEARA
jgi:glycosyltransferase involved in cell wall biosynthesis